MKILLIDNSLDQTGASKALFQIIKGLPTDEFGFIFLFPQNSKCVEEAKMLGYGAWEMKFVEISKSIKNLALYFPRLYLNAGKLKKLIKKENIQIVHVNDLYNMTGLAVKLFSGVKLVTHIRRMPESFPAMIYKTWSRLHVKYADHIIAVSKANKKELPANNKTTVIYDPLPEEEKLPKFTTRIALQKRISILYLANFTNGKGHHYALQILNRAVKEFSDWEFFLHFYGGNFGMQKNDELKQSLIKFAQTNGLSGFVHFHEKTNEVEATMKAHDLVLNLSDSESFSRVTLEALFYGVPIIATNVGGTNEMVIDGETGLLAEPFNIEDMYAAFKKMISDDILRTAMAAKGYQYVRETFSHNETTGKLAAAYRSVNG